MSANLEFVRSIYEAWGQGDFSSVEWADADIEYIYADGIQAGTSVGMQGMYDAFSDWIGVFRDWTVKGDDYIELDGDHVLVPFSSTALVKRSGPDGERLRSDGATLFQMRDERVTRIVQYNERDHAFAVLGLEG